jgi:hypothetical protein
MGGVLRTEQPVFGDREGQLYVVDLGNGVWDVAMHPVRTKVSIAKIIKATSGGSNGKVSK